MTGKAVPREFFAYFTEVIYMSDFLNYMSIQKQLRSLGDNIIS